MSGAKGMAQTGLLRDGCPSKWYVREGIRGPRAKTREAREHGAGRRRAKQARAWGRVGHLHFVSLRGGRVAFFFAF